MDINAPDLEPDLTALFAELDHDPITVKSLDDVAGIINNPDQRITVDMTALEWELFTASMECEPAADALNTAATEALACGNHADAADIWEAAATQWRDFGAFDTEPRYVIATLLTARYGQSII